MINSVKVNDRDMSNFKFHRVCERKSGRERDCASFGEAVRKNASLFCYIFPVQTLSILQIKYFSTRHEYIKVDFVKFFFVFLLLVPISSLNVNNQILIEVQISLRF